MGHMIGIDLGTTNTAVCAMIGGRPKMIKNKKGYTVFPSAVFENSSGKIIVGRQAKTAMMTEPDRGVFAVKRLLGRRFDSEEVSQIRKQVPYEIKAATDGSCLVQMAGNWYTPMDIAAFILKEARSIAEAEIGEEVDQAVITVPAYYNHGQREATKQAAAQAGLQCDRIINEPTAAALAYGERKTGERTVLIFDLGGGTFDVSILQFSEGLVETLATKGDTFLGGEDFDERLLDLLADQFFNSQNKDPREESIARRRLKDAAEAAKCELSFRDRTNILVPRLLGTTNLEASLSRGELEQIVDDLVQKAIQVTSEAVTDADIRLQDVDDLVLVGGQTRMPLIRQRISTLLHSEPVYGVNPEEVVATGACVHGFSLVSERSTAPILMDVTPFDLGVDIRGGFFERIISRNTHVPTMETKSFSTGRVGQDSVRVVIRQGESRYAAENEFLGEFVMSNLMPNDQGIASVEVTLRLDANGMLHVSATDPATGERHNITARNYAQFLSNGEEGLDISSDHQQGNVQRPSQKAASHEPEVSQTKDAKEEKPKSGFFSRLFGRKSSPEASIDLRSDREAQSNSGADAESLTDALETIDFDNLLPAGNEEPSQADPLETDDSLFELLNNDPNADSLQELDFSALSEIEDDEDSEEVEPEIESKVATLGMGDSSSAAEQSVSSENRSDVQFEGQDDTLLIDVFNDDSAVDSLLFDGLDEPTDSEAAVPQPIDDGIDGEADISALLSSILDDQDGVDEGDTQIMDRAQMLSGIDKPNELLETGKGDISEEDDALAMLLNELEQDVTSPSPSNTAEAMEEEESGDAAEDLLSEFEVEFDFDASGPSSDDLGGTEEQVEETFAEEQADIDSLLADYDAIEETVTSAEKTDISDIDSLLAEFENDVEGIPSNEAVAAEDEEQGGLGSIDAILSGEDDVDIDSFLASLDIPEIDAIDSEESETFDIKDDPEGESPVSFDSEIDDETVTSLFEREHPKTQQTNAETASEASDKGDDSIEETAEASNVLSSAIAVEENDVFDSLPDDGFFDHYSEPQTPKQADGQKIDLDLDDVEVEDEPLEIPKAEEEEGLDFLDDLFDD
ncbi:MAG: Hsp70 family protein [Myxococcota bacterium]